ncbi:hypothetical protein GTV32_02620 [Gordonia sp. SID5947]|uniref:hypothetical protein n=1 Tax=Gordonia sp. SID5947 TaxID=2690315 RepID=UPI00137227A3|nr:hypothetical protein [Gordonia sp. SID5947]MYR05280.1 hypothetical protein [Gordonia sp. SID5947]
MTSGQPPRHDVAPQAHDHHRAGHPVDPYTGSANAPQFWLRSGPMLPQRTWQRSTRSPIIVISSLAAMALAAVAVAALLVGTVNRTSFTARGVVVCPTAEAQALQIGPGATVQIYDETGGELSTTTLGQRRSGDGGRCEMPFRAHDVESGRDGYVIRIGDVLQETVSESALSSGVVLRPVS